MAGTLTSWKGDSPECLGRRTGGFVGGPRCWPGWAKTAGTQGSCGHQLPPHLVLPAYLGQVHPSRAGEGVGRPGWAQQPVWPPLPGPPGIPQGFGSSSLCPDHAFVIITTERRHRAGLFGAPAAVITLQSLISKKPHERVHWSLQWRRKPGDVRPGPPSGHRAGRVAPEHPVLVGGGATAGTRAGLSRGSETCRWLVN